MKYDNNYLLKLTQTNGVPASLDMIDIENIEDETVKIICRTIKFSMEALIRELETRVKQDQEVRTKK